MSYFILLIIILVLAITSYFIFDKDFLSPSFITCIVYFFSIIMSLFGLFTWNTEREISFKTILIVGIGVLCVFLGELLFNIIIKKINKEKDEDCNKISKKKYSIHQSIYINYFVIAFLVLTIAFTYKGIYDVCVSYGHVPTSISNMLEFYRQKTLMYNTNLQFEIPFIVKQFQKIAYFICFYSAYILIYNILTKENKKYNFQYAISIILTFVLALLTSSRSILFHFIVGIIFLYFIMKRNIVKDFKINYGKLFIGVALLLVLFFALTPLVGRKNNMNFVEYITFYSGSPIPTLERGLKEDIIKVDTHHLKTFYGVYYSLAKLKIIPNYPTMSNVGIKFGEYGGSNVYTSFSSYYSSLGFIGVAGLALGFGFLISMFYYFVKNKNNVFIIVMYAYYFYVLIDQFRCDSFYSLISISTISYLVISYILYKLYIRGEKYV